MGKKAKKTTYYDYYISGHWGFCLAPVDSVEEVYFKEKPVLDGSPLIMNTAVQINKPDLFGGYEREGGIVGTLQYLSGIASQVLPFALAKRLGLLPETAPAYRGIMSLALHGDDNSDRDGAIIGSNYPSVPPIWARVRAACRTLETNDPIIVSPDGKRHNLNPASMIFECLTDPSWGMGGDPDEQYIPSFLAAAATLKEENLGLSMLWTRQMAVEQFIQEVLNHIKALYYVNPYTGLGHLKLLRNDYNPATLNQYSEDDYELVSYRRKLWGETVNEISVTWTDPDTESERTVTFQDPGNIAMQGDVIGETRNYYGIRDEETATMIANRDIVEVSAPLASAVIRINRMRWKEMPGDCIRFLNQKYGITNTIMRVMDVDWGTVDDAKITVNLLEDIFGIAYAKFERPGPPEWEDPDDDPDGPEYAALPSKYFAAPYTLMQQELTEEQRAEFLNDDRYPEVLPAYMVWPDEEQDDLQAFVMNVRDVDTTGAVSWLPVGEKTLTGKATLAEPLVREVETSVLYAEKIGGDGPEVGRYALISADVGESNVHTDRVDEWVLILEKLSPGYYKVARGVLDTVPRNWPVGTHIFFISESFNGYDTGGALAGVTKNYKLQPRTSKGLRNIDLVGEDPMSEIDRPYLPYRPANCRINGGSLFDFVDYTQKGDPSDVADDTHNPRAAEEWDMLLSWSNRNRTMEENIVLKWDAGTVPLEAGQTTELVIKATEFAEEEINRITGLTGTSYTFNLQTQTQRYLSFVIQYVSKRDGFESLQYVTRGVSVYPKGFGSDFGYIYGGWPGDEGVLTDVRVSDLDIPMIEGHGEAEIDTSTILKLESAYRITHFGKFDRTLLPMIAGHGSGS